MKDDPIWIDVIIPRSSSPLSLSIHHGYVEIPFRARRVLLLASHQIIPSWLIAKERLRTLLFMLAYGLGIKSRDLHGGKASVVSLWASS